MNGTRRRALFVDDEPRILDGICRMLRPQRGELEVLTAIGGEEALAQLAAAPVDVVVSDMRMPKMDGAELLAAVRQRHPRIVRIILSGQSDRDTIIRATRTAHQFLSKPCDPAELRATIARSCALRDLLPDPIMQERIASLEALPSAPGALDALWTELAGNGSPERVSRLVAADPGLAGKVLQITATSFFGTPRGVLTPGEAALRLGSDVLRTMVGCGALPDAVMSQIDLAKWAATARRTASIARAFAARTDPTLADAAETAGLLHDCGLLALISAPGAAGTILKISGDELAIATPADAGAFLLALWGLPDLIVEAVGRHRHPGARPVRHPTLCGIVHAAHVFAENEEQRLDLAFLNTAIPTFDAESWRQISTGACL